MPILANLCDKACFAHKFSWLAKRDATISPVKAKKKAPKVLSLSQDKQLYKLLVSGGPTNA